MRDVVIAMTLLLVTPTVALASDWKRVGSSAQATVFVDAESITRDLGLVRAWVKWNFTEPQSNSDGSTYLSKRQRWTIRCEARQAAVGSAASFPELDLNGDALGATNFLSSVWFDAPPDTVEEAILKFACKHAP